MNLEQAKLNLQFADYLERKVPLDEFTMSSWGYKRVHECRTPACVAGHAACYAPFRIDWSSIKIDDDLFDETTNKVANAMGFSNVEAELLFLWDYDPDIDMATITVAMAANALREIVYSHFPALRPGEIARGECEKFMPSVVKQLTGSGSRGNFDEA